MAGGHEEALAEIVDVRTDHRAAMAARDWIYAQWGVGEETEAEHTEWFDRSFLEAPAFSAPFPVCLAAMVDGAPAATASLVEDDGLGPPYDPPAGFTPWIAAVYTVPAFRRRGLARLLVRACLRRLEDAGVQSVYLYTPDQQRLYTSLGFEAFAVTRNGKGKAVTLMRGRV